MSSTTIGVVLLAVVLALLVVLFNKDRVSTTLMSGETIEVRFDRAYKLRPHVSEVKVAYVPVGKVVSVERDGNDAVVELKVDEEVLENLGTEPTATVRPTTLLGGSYFVDLEPGGDPGEFTAGTIPVERTRVPVELDQVARALQPEALEGVQSFVAKTDATLDDGGDVALDRLLAAAPQTLDDAGAVLESARGYRPNRDLAAIVSGLESTARVLTRTDGQVDRIITGLGGTAEVLGTHSDDLQQTLDEMPAALDSTRAGLSRLDRTLITLRDMSDDTRTVTDDLDVALAELDPTLVSARAIMPDARFVVARARPVVADLVPSAETGRRVLGDVAGPVLDRVNGPLTDWLYAKYDGKAPYSLTHSEKTMYEEVGYFFTNLTRASGYMDRNGHAVSFQPGVGSGSVGGLPVSFEQIFKALVSQYYPEAPTDTMPPLSDSGNPQAGDGSLPGGLLGGGR